MSEYQQTIRRLEKIKNSLENLISENSYKKLRQEIDRLRQQKKLLYEENQGLRIRFEAQSRILEKATKSIEETQDPEQVRTEDRTTAKES